MNSKKGKHCPLLIKLPEDGTNVDNWEISELQQVVGEFIQLQNAGYTACKAFTSVIGY